MATRSLSPKRIAERMQRHRLAVRVLAMQRAKQAVREDIRAKGFKLAQFSAKEITLLAEDYFTQHRARLIADAEHAIATWPGFARWRLPDCANLVTPAHPQSGPKSTTSTVQMSGAK